MKINVIQNHLRLSMSLVAHQEEITTTTTDVFARLVSLRNNQLEIFLLLKTGCLKPLQSL